jgi:hypothetical protein
MSQQDVFFEPSPQWMPAPSAVMGRLWSRTSKLKVVWDVTHAIGDWRGVTFAPGRSGLSISLSGVTLGHLDWNGRLDLPFGPEVSGFLVEEGMAELDASALCVMLNIQSAADIDRAICLLRLAYLIMDPQGQWKIHPR